MKGCEYFRKALYLFIFQIKIKQTNQIKKINKCTFMCEED